MVQKKKPSEEETKKPPVNENDLPLMERLKLRAAAANGNNPTYPTSSVLKEMNN